MGRRIVTHALVTLLGACCNITASLSEKSSLPNRRHRKPRLFIRAQYTRTAHSEPHTTLRNISPPRLCPSLSFSRFPRTAFPPKEHARRAIYTLVPTAPTSSSSLLPAARRRISDKARGCRCCYAVLKKRRRSRRQRAQSVTSAERERRPSLGARGGARARSEAPTRPRDWRAWPPRGRTIPHRPLIAVASTCRTCLLPSDRELCQCVF